MASFQAPSNSCAWAKPQNSSTKAAINQQGCAGLWVRHCDTDPEILRLKPAPNFTSLVIEGDKMTATAEGTFVDYWERVR
jgi:hypothetical protein